MKNRRLKIAFLSFGFLEYSVRLASALAQEAETLLLLPGEQADRYTSMLHPAVRFQPFSKPRLRQPMRQVRMIARLLRQIEDFKPDVLHVQAGHQWFNFALPFLRRYPLVITVHDAMFHIGDKASHKGPWWIGHFGYRCANQLIVHAEQLKHVLIERLHISEQRVHVIPIVAHGDATAQPHVREGNNVILFFGRIWEYKGLDYLIRAEPLIAEQVPDAQIVIAGQGEDFARYRRLMAHPERFTVHNEYVSDEKCAELFRRASIVVLPYIEASQSAVVPIAYTFAKPVIATTVGGLPEIVEHGRTGLLVPPRDQRALAEAIVRLLRDADLRHQLGANGKQKVEMEHSAEAVARRTLPVYLCAIESMRTHAQREKAKSI
jgi:glycosyltransferase involved in cell wall biosynthesis